MRYALCQRILLIERLERLELSGLSEDINQIIK